MRKTSWRRGVGRKRAEAMRRGVVAGLAVLTGTAGACTAAGGVTLPVMMAGAAPTAAVTAAALGAGAVVYVAAYAGAERGFRRLLLRKPGIPPEARGLTSAIDLHRALLVLCAGAMGFVVAVSLLAPGSHAVPGARGDSAGAAAFLQAAGLLGGLGHLALLALCHAPPLRRSDPAGDRPQKP